MLLYSIHLLFNIISYSQILAVLVNWLLAWDVICFCNLESCHSWASDNCFSDWLFKCQLFLQIKCLCLLLHKNTIPRHINCLCVHERALVNYPTSCVLTCFSLGNHRFVWFKKWMRLLEMHPSRTFSLQKMHHFGMVPVHMLSVSNVISCTVHLRTLRFVPS